MVGDDEDEDEESVKRLRALLSKAENRTTMTKVIDIL
jgi:hypothetical protein